MKSLKCVHLKPHKWLRSVSVMLICDSPIGTFPNYNIMIQFVPLGQIGMLHKYYMLSMSMGENDLLPQAFASYFYVMSRNDKFRQF